MDEFPKELIHLTCYYFLGGRFILDETHAGWDYYPTDYFKNLRYFFNRLRCLSKINKHWYDRMPWDLLGRYCGTHWYCGVLKGNIEFYGHLFHTKYPIGGGGSSNGLVCRQHWSQRFYYLAMLQMFHRPKRMKVRQRLNPQGGMFQPWADESLAMHMALHQEKYKEKQAMTQMRRKRTREAHLQDPNYRPKKRRRKEEKK